MFYVYVLYSARLRKRYVGSADDIPTRLYQHNAGRSRFTSGGIPWTLVHSESFNTRSEARKRERFLKPDLRNGTSDRTRNNNVPTGPEANTRSPIFHIQAMAPMAFPESQYLRLCMAAPVKKNSKTKTLARSEALDEALCFGWIDGQGQKSDGEFWLQKFTPRRPRSMWSKRNREHVARLIKEKRMTPAGLAQIKAAKADGRWKQAYDSPANMSVPADFLRKLKKNKAVHDFYKTLNKANTYAIA